MARQRKPAQSPIRSELKFRAGGLAPRIGWQHEGVLWSGAFRKLMTVTRDTGKRKKSPTQRDRIFHQRVAVRVRYSKRGRAGQWKAHGHYIQRESAIEGKGGFDESANTVKPSERLDQWQKQGDELLWKIIISPERGNELDMEQSHPESLIRAITLEKNRSGNAATKGGYRLRIVTPERTSAPLLHNQPSC